MGEDKGSYALSQLVNLLKWHGSRRIMCKMRVPLVRHQLPRDTAIGPISISRWRGSKRRRKGLSAVNPRRTGASASAPETRSVGIFERERTDRDC